MLLSDYFKPVQFGGIVVIDVNVVVVWEVLSIVDTTDVGVIVEPEEIVDVGVAIDVLNTVVVDEIDVVEETDVSSFFVEVDVVRPPVVGL